jgi:hypothetical protein
MSASDFGEHDGRHCHSAPNQPQICQLSRKLPWPACHLTKTYSPRGPLDHEESSGHLRRFCTMWGRLTGEMGMSLSGQWLLAQPRGWLGLARVSGAWPGMAGPWNVTPR